MHAKNLRLCCVHFVFAHHKRGRFKWPCVFLALGLAARSVPRVYGKNEEYTAKPASREALVSFILQIYRLTETSSSTTEARTALPTAPLFLSSGLGLVILLPVRVVV